ncbi:hypothetical protein [Amycolatopsis sp. NPDC049868]
MAAVNVRPDVVYRPVGDVTPYRTLALGEPVAVDRQIPQDRR